MRTKTKVLSALIGLASFGAVVAQAQVYSQNVVGYVNTTCPPGFSIIANPLVTATNKTSQLIKNPPDMTAIYLWDSAQGFLIANYYSDGMGGGEWDNDFNFSNGDAMWVLNPATTNLVITFVGEVPQSGTGFLTNAIPSGFSLKGSRVPQAGYLDSVLGFSPLDMDAIYLYRNGGFTICNYYSDGQGGGEWDTVPDPQVGEGFWVLTSTGRDWKRSFNVQ